MTYTVYIDVLFAVNLLMDGILLLLVRSCLRLHAPSWRILLAAGAGAAWGCLAEVGLLAGPAAGYRPNQGVQINVPDFLKKGRDNRR